MKISFFRYVGVTLFTLCLLGLSFLYYHDVRPTGLTTFLPSPFPKHVGFTTLLPQEPKLFHITATKPNLGIVEVRFASLKRIEDYGLLFRIKKSGDVAWYYEHVYYFNPFMQNGLYPFGFPTIAESQGKEFEIEIAAIGNKDVPIVISDQYPSIVLKYQTPLSTLKYQGTNAMISFAIDKVMNTITNRNFLINLLLFCFPLGFLVPILLKKKIDEIITIGVLLNVIVFDGLKIIHIENDILYVFVSLGLLYEVWTKSLHFAHIFSVALSSLLAAVICVLFNQVSAAERFAIWTYIVSSIGVISGAFSFRYGHTMMAKHLRIFSTLLMVFLAFSSVVSLSMGAYQIMEYSRKVVRPYKSDLPYISFVGPLRNYHQGFVVIEGSGFGDRYDTSLHIMSDYGEIEEYAWSDHRITFRIPLHWKVGTVDIWLETDEAERLQKYPIFLLDKSAQWSAEDDAYYQELLAAPDSVREANGYIREWYR